MEEIKKDLLRHGFFCTELTTGLRRGELLALQWDDLSFKTGTLRVERQVHRAKGELIIPQPKTKAANRTITLPAPLLSVLKNKRCLGRGANKSSQILQTYLIQPHTAFTQPDRQSGYSPAWPDGKNIPETSTSKPERNVSGCWRR